MMQEVGLTPELRVRELVDRTASYYPHPLTAAQTLDVTGTGPLANRPYRKLSAGQKRQVQFALAIVAVPNSSFSTSRPSVSTSKPAQRCGERSAR